MNELPTPEIQDRSRPWWGGLSLIWIVPFAALAVTLGVGWKAYSDRGPLVVIEFEDGAGIAPGQTELRFRDVRVGLVEQVHFGEGLRSVLAHVRIEKAVAPYVDSDATFWVVRPQLSPSGVSGLDTVLTGVFIEGSWDSEIGPAAESFRGLDAAPLYRSEVEGLRFSLRAAPGTALSSDTAIVYRGVEVGRVGSARIADEGSYAIAEAIIYEPYARLVTESTRFWDTSGFSVSIGPSGAQIDFTSVATLLAGGVTFDTFVSGSAPVADGAVFEIHGSETQARNSVFNSAEVETLELRVIFDENVSGLALNAPVELNGLRVGSVEHLSGIVDPDAFGDERVRLNVVLGIQPARLGLQGEVSAAQALVFLEQRVREGLRARLASGNILTGGLRVELVEVPSAPPALIEIEEGRIPTIPSTESNVTDTAATVEGVFTRINSLPFEELLLAAIDFMDSARALVASEAVAGAPQDLRALLDDIRGVVTSESVQEIPVTINNALGRLDAILAQIEQEQAVARVLAAIDATTEAARTVGGSVDGVPALIEELAGVAARAQLLPLEELTDQISQILRSADAVIGAPAMQELPASLAGALDELDRTLAELRAGGAVENVNATLASTRDAADAVALTARDLPALVERMTQVFDEASATIAGYNKGEVVSRDAQAALRDISEASRAISALARLLERNPSVLIMGR